MNNIVFTVPTHQKHFAYLSQAILYSYNMTNEDTPLVPIFCQGDADFPETAIVACSHNEDKGPQVAYNNDYPWALIEGSE
jgi:hypothetical protein